MTDSTESASPETPLGESEIDRKLREAAERSRAARIEKYGTDTPPSLRDQVEAAIRRRDGSREPKRLDAIMAMVDMTCSACTRVVSVDQNMVPFLGGICEPCHAEQRVARLEAFRERENARLQETVHRVLTSIGMQPSEASAEPGKVPAPIKRAAAQSDLTGFLTGHALGPAWRGFGLLGGAGAGKTMCLASMVGLRVGALVRTEITALQDDREWVVPPPAVTSRLVWVNWPEASGALRSLAGEPGGMHDIEARARRWMSVELLIVDDIGRERMKGGYEDDFSHGYLDRVIDSRSRTGRAILWTSNLTHVTLAKRYGEAFCSRLLGLAPMVGLPALPDKRLVP